MLKHSREQKRSCAESCNRNCIWSIAPDWVKRDVPDLHKAAIIDMPLSTSHRRNQVLPDPLRSGLLWRNVSVFARETKMERPDTRDGQAIRLWWSKPPFSRGLRRDPRKILAWPC